MNAIKRSKYKLEKKKLTFFLLGLVTALSIVYVCFEWTSENITIYKVEDLTDLLFEPDAVIQTLQDETPPPPPKSQPDVIEKINIVKDDVQTEDIEFDSSEDTESNAQKIIDQPISLKEPEEEEEELEEVFVYVEHMPEPPGGAKGLMNYLSRHVRYPIVAQENGIQGRVVCQFTVFKDGSIGDIKVLRGVHKSLDNEAVRLLASMPKWKPGRQQGKPVNCKYTVPVVFRLQ